MKYTFEQIEPVTPVTLDMMPENVACVVDIYDEQHIRMHDGNAACVVMSDGEMGYRVDDPPSDYHVLSRLDNKPLPVVEVPLKERTRGVWYAITRMPHTHCMLDDNNKVWSANSAGMCESSTRVGAEDILTTGPGFKRVEVGEKKPSDSYDPASIQRRFMAGMEAFFAELNNPNEGASDE